ncbi:F-box/kelch-repeat protein At3g23880-like [Solanum stenotomum]|uniref:F-box/kelch-repeat protein At3g23880-like n=1 Tax=Solanum stenotomum TaxID=172797 RepID=UPI0020D0BACA|nr:F-box/kelch-repeat protein At3g23880-like [Solanum stenotomum]
MSNSWTSVDNSCPPSGLSSNICGKFVNGKFHWATTPFGFEYNPMNCDQNIISFDLADEKWGKVENPSYGEGDMVPRLQMLGSNLSIFCYNKEKYVSIWVMKEYGVKESWTKMFVINCVDNPYVCNLPYFMSNKGEILVAFARRFKIYNSKDVSFSPKVINFDHILENVEIYVENVEIYVESLVSPFPSEEGRTSDATKIQAKKAQIKTIK